MVKKIGLTLGKFAPMHIGHEALVVESLEVVDELYVLLYDCPDKTSIPLAHRAEWVRHAFPSQQVKVIEGYDAPNRHEDSLEVKRLQEEYLLKEFKNIPLTHFLSSEYYGDHLSEALEVTNVVLDEKRMKHGMTATLVRENVWKNCKKMSPNVYFDVLYKVVIIGDGHDEIKHATAVAKYFKTIVLQNKSINLNTLRGLSEIYIKKQVFEDNREEYIASDAIYNARDIVLATTNLITGDGMKDRALRSSEQTIKLVNRFDKIIIMNSASARIRDFILSQVQNTDSVVMDLNSTKEIILELKKIATNKLFS